MPKFTSGNSDPHKQEEITGILVTNLGTPDNPSVKAVRRYLAEFLSDSRVIEFPRWLWWGILHGIVLRNRPKKSAENYAKIWQDQGSPLLIHSQFIARDIEKILTEKHQKKTKVVLGMRYGKPSIAKALQELRDANATRIIVLPLYPQYSATTTAATFDAITKELNHWRFLPSINMINQYAGDDAYITALANKIQKHWDVHGKGEKILFSFHGLPEAYFKKGDPYYCYCCVTAKALAEKLKLDENSWQMVFQSRLGPKKWLQPYCDKTLQKLPKSKIKSVDIVCPGFAADCLETLEEIAMTNKDLFMQAGGEQYKYIPALNDDPEHIDALCNIILRQW